LKGCGNAQVAPEVSAELVKELEEMGFSVNRYDIEPFCESRVLNIREFAPVQQICTA
jgi:hypothetical protein